MEEGKTLTLYYRNDLYVGTQELFLDYIIDNDKEIISKYLIVIYDDTYKYIPIYLYIFLR